MRRLLAIGAGLSAVAALAAGAQVGAAAPVSASAPPDAAALDGLIVRLTGPMLSNGGGKVGNCSLSELTTGPRAVPVTLRPSDGGWTTSRATVPHWNAGAEGSISYAPDGFTVVGADGDLAVSGGGSVLALDVSADADYWGDCTLSQIGHSAAGDVFPAKWTACDAACTSGSIAETYPHGTGCVAVSAAGGVLTVTAQLGTCTPGAFPAIAAPSASTPPRSTAKPAQKPPQCKAHQRSTRTHPCRRR